MADYGPQTEIIRTLIARADQKTGPDLVAEVTNLAAEWDGDHAADNKPRDRSFAATGEVSLAPQWRPLAFAEASPVVSPWSAIVPADTAHSAMHAIFDAISALLIEDAIGGTPVAQSDLTRLMRPVNRVFGPKNQW